jgi:RHS repeat-associated protein
LLGQYDNGGATGTGQQEVIWLPIENGNAIPVGLYHRGQLHTIHTDHLGTPRRISDETGSTVWQWPLSAFGDNAPIGLLQESKASATGATSTDPSIEASKPKVSTIKATKPGIEFNLRYPGQYFDSETGTHYNYYRDNYDPTQGRYRQPDPIGLDGGLNRFGYVGGNPLSYSDPTGLAYFAVRPLQGMPWLGLLSNNPLDNAMNTAIAHEQLFFEDGKSPANQGFFGDSKLKTENSLDGYKRLPGQYNDCVMRMAARAADAGKYNLVTNNCQSWADRVRDQYNKLMQSGVAAAACGL